MALWVSPTASEERETDEGPGPLKELSMPSSGPAMRTEVMDSSPQLALGIGYQVDDAGEAG
jgi:hypothetical protein